MKNLTKVLVILFIFLICIGYFYQIAILFAVIVVVVLAFLYSKKQTDDKLSNITKNDNIRNFKPKKANTFSKSLESKFKEKRLLDDKSRSKANAKNN